MGHNNKPPSAQNARDSQAGSRSNKLTCLGDSRNGRQHLGQRLTRRYVTTGNDGARLGRQCGRGFVSSSGAGRTRRAGGPVSRADRQVKDQRAVSQTDDARKVR
jgi:hypothetical protein